MSCVVYECFQQGRIDILFAARMEVNSRHSAGTLVEANVVEAFETGSSNGLDFVVRYQKVFFPPHKEMLALSIILACKVWRFGLLG